MDIVLRSIITTECGEHETDMLCELKVATSRSYLQFYEAPSQNVFFLARVTIRICDQFGGGGLERFSCV